MRRVTVKVAAELLGISEDAVRKRVLRGGLEADRRDGTVHVLLPDNVQDVSESAAGPVQDSASNEHAAVVAALERVIENQQAMIEGQKRTIADLWDMVGLQEEARKEARETLRREQELRSNDQEALKAHLVNHQLVLRQLETRRELGAGTGSDESATPTGSTGKGRSWLRRFRGA